MFVLFYSKELLHPTCGNNIPQQNLLEEAPKRGFSDAFNGVFGRVCPRNLYRYGELFFQRIANCFLLERQKCTNRHIYS